MSIQSRTYTSTFYVQVVTWTSLPKHLHVHTLRYYITWPVVYTSMRAGPPTMSYIDSANQEVCTQLLRLHYGVCTLHRLPNYVRITFTLHKLFFLSATVTFWDLVTDDLYQKITQK